MKVILVQIWFLLSCSCQS